MKGKEEPQDAYELISPTEVKTRIEASAVCRPHDPSSGGRKRWRPSTRPSRRPAQAKVRSWGSSERPGSGKSRIILEMRHLFPEFTYLEGRCLHYGGSMAYLPLLDILRSYFGIKEGERECLIKRKMREKVSSLDETLLSPFQDLLSLKVGRELYLKLEPKEKRERIFEALRDLFIRESQKTPLVLIVEDLHWIDKTSEEFLDYLIGWLATTPHPPHPPLPARVYPPLGEQVLLSRTSGWTSSPYRRAAELVQSILSEGEIVPELRDLILTKAAGNPLFMEELTHTLLENGSIEKKDNRYLLSRKPSDIQIPDTVQGIIAARMDRLDESLKRIMHVASVIGREFAFRILQSITEMKEGAEGPPPQPPGPGVHLREATLPRAGVRLQACPHPGGGLQQPPPHPEKGDPREDRQSHRRALSRQAGGVLRDARLPLLTERQ